MHEEEDHPLRPRRVMGGRDQSLIGEHAFPDEARESEHPEARAPPAEKFSSADFTPAGLSWH